MNPIKVREMTVKETPLFVKWLYAHKEVVQVDAELYRRNQVKMFVAEDAKTGEILAFFPVASVFLFVGHAPKPGLSPLRISRCLQAVQDYMVGQCREFNVPSMWVQPSDEQFAGFLKRIGWETIPNTLRFNVNKIVTRAASKLQSQMLHITRTLKCS